MADVEYFSRDTALTKAKVKEAHRRMMIANHPDRGGAPFLASKINEAKVGSRIVATYSDEADNCLLSGSSREGGSQVTDCIFYYQIILQLFHHCIITTTRVTLYPACATTSVLIPVPVASI